MLDTYTNREDETLESLKIYPMKTLALEEKDDEEMFEEYDPNQIIVKINKWNRQLISQAEVTSKATNIKVQKDELMSNFMQELS